MSKEKVIIFDSNVYSKIKLYKKIKNGEREHPSIKEKDLVKEINKIKKIDKVGNYISIVYTILEAVDSGKEYNDVKEKIANTLEGVFKFAKDDTDIIDKIETKNFITHIMSKSLEKQHLIELSRNQLKRKVQLSTEGEKNQLCKNLLDIFQNHNLRKDSFLSVLIITSIYKQNTSILKGILKPNKENKRKNAFHDLNIIEFYFTFKSIVGKRYFMKNGKKLSVDLLTFDKNLRRLFIFARRNIQCKLVGDSIFYTTSISKEIYEMIKK